MAGSLNRDAVLDIVQSMRRFARDLSLGVARLPSGIRGAEESARLVGRVADRLERELLATVGRERRLAFRQIESIWRQAGLEIAEIRDLPTAMIGGVRNPPISMLGAYENVGGASNWRTLLPRYTGRAAQEANHIVREALLQGVSPDELARRLRPYVEGSQPFHRAFGGLAEKIDLRRLREPGLEGAARQMDYNARRIAVTETHNARAEAEVQHFIADPYIRAVAWRLAPDRGTQEGSPDECNVLAEQDLYGLGDGIYPCDKVPLSPHPFCRCERVPVTQDTPDGAARAELQTDPRDIEIPGVSAARGDAIRGRVARLVRDSEAEPLSNELAARVREDQFAAAVGAP